MWTLAFGHHEDRARLRTDARGPDGGVRQEAAAGNLTHTILRPCTHKSRLLRQSLAAANDVCGLRPPESSGDLLPPSPPAEKATARQDQAGKASTDDWTNPLAPSKKVGDGCRPPPRVLPPFEGLNVK
jgi:hypothetical protein